LGEQHYNQVEEENPMSIIPDEIQNQVREIFQTLNGPVSLMIFTQSEGGEDEPGLCNETRQLVEEVASLSDKIDFQRIDLIQDAELAARYHIEKVPALVIQKGGEQSKDYGIRLYGIPAGYEFTSLIEDIRMVSNGKAGLSDATLKELEKLDHPVHIQVFVTPTCSYCPQAVVLAHKLALASDQITADMVEAEEFPQLAEHYQVMGVPRTVINEVVHIEGALPEKALVTQLMQVMDEHVMGILKKQWEIELN
jgi:glutaredoxin-like protein